MASTDIIAPEIKNDQFYEVIRQIGEQLLCKNILEIGSSSGAGSTEAWVQGITKNPHRPTLHCLEVSKPRYEVLKETYAHCDQVNCHWSSSVDATRFPDPEEVRYFYEHVDNALRQYPLEQVLGWLQEDIAYFAEANPPEGGIRKILREQGLYYFDAVLIDGSEFLGAAEFAEVYGAPVILLDDTRGFKCYHACEWLRGDPSYKLIAENPNLRNGFAVFQRVQ